MTIIDIVNMYNNDGLSLAKIGEKVGKSKSTVQRMLITDGWYYDKETKKYFHTVDNVVNETIKAIDNVSRETIKIVNRTYGIPSDVDRALKIMCAIEGKNAVDVVREALRNAIDEKYFKI